MGDQDPLTRNDQQAFIFIKATNDVINKTDSVFHPMYEYNAKSFERAVGVCTIEEKQTREPFKTQ